MTARSPCPGSYHPTLIALEPRMMFDAAAVVAAQDALGASGPDHVADAGGAERSHDVHPALGDPLTVEARTIAAPLAAAEPPSREIVFIDTSVADYRQLAAEWADRGEVVLVDGTADGLDQVRAALAGRSDLSAIHLVGHGASGVLWLGTTRIDAGSIGGDLAASLGAVGRSLGQGGDILIYGCDFAAGDAGARALAAFADATGADVAASIDTTGYAGRGGDWVLEAERGTIESRALASGDWVHTLDPNVPVPISVAVGSLTVRDGNGNVVFSSANNYNNNAARSPDVGVGAVATWANAATFQGRSVDLKATVVSLTQGDAVQFNRVTGTGTGPDDPTFLLRDLTSGTTPATVQLRWTLVDSATGDPLPANVRFTIADIDGIGGNPHTRETVTASTQNLAYYTRERVSDIHFTSSLDAIEASGTQDENNPVGATLTPQSAATFDWTDVSAFTLTYTLTPNANTTQAQFYHDGDADFVYTDPVYVSVPRLDLDRDDSTAPGNDARFTFTEDGPAAPIVDADLVVTNPMGPTAIVGATVTLTNYKAADAFTVGTLPSNISASIGQPTNGRLVVTLTGNGSEADYTAALKAIGFRNTSDAPDPTQRVIEVAFSNDTLTSAVATSRIDVVPVNDAPVAGNDSVTTPEDTAATIAVLGNDRDPDGDPLTVIAASALHGTVVRNPDGTLTYTPAANYNGADTISYTVSDGGGGTADATVAVTVTPVNDAPQAARIPTSYFVVDGGAVNVSVADIFGDVDRDTLTYAATGLPAGVTLDTATGRITGIVDRSASQANNGRYPVVITATDPSGAQATQRVSVTALNPAPVAGDDRAATAEDRPVTITVLANDSDPDRDPLTVTAASAQNGTVVRNPDGTLTYTPNADFNGTDTIRYTISDGQGGTDQATVTVDVAPQRDTPANRLPPAQTVAEDTALVFSAANGNAITVANVDGGDLTVTLAAGHGRVTLSRIDGLVFADGDGSDDAAMTVTGSVAAINAALDGARFVGDADYHGPADLRITTTRAPVEGEEFLNGGAEDPVVPQGNFSYLDQSLVPGWSTTEPDGIIEVWPTGYNGVDAREGAQFFEINAEQPTTLYQTFRSTAGQAISVAFSHRGRTGDDTMRLSAVDLGADGVFGTADDSRLFSQDYTTGNADWRDYAAAITASATGNLVRLEFTAVSQAGSNLSEGNFLDAIHVASGAVPLTATDTLAITITPVADIVPDRATTPEDNAVVIDALADDGFADPARAIVAIDGQAIVAGGAPVVVANGTVSLDAAGRLTFAPTRDYNGTTAFTYTVAAGGSTETATETVVVTPVNDAPVAIGALVDRAANDGAAVSWAIAAGFGDVDGDTLTYTAAGLPAGLSIDPRTGVISGTVDRSASQSGGGRYTVTVTARDGGATAASQQFRVDVANPAPAAADDAAITHANTAATIAVLGNDRDPDGDPLTVTAATAGRGRVEILADNSLRYVPPAGFVGRDTVTYTITDGEGGTATAQVTVDVYNDPPTADPAGTVMVRDGQAISLPIGAGFRDPDGDPLTFIATGLPPGLAIDRATGTIAGTVDRAASRAANGTYTTTVTADDGLGGTSAVTFDWLVANPPPVAADDAATLAEDTPATLSPLANDSDPDGDPLTMVAAGAGHGRVAINPDGTLTYTPDRDFNGNDTIVYTVDDGDGGRATASIAVTVTPVDDAPTTTGLPSRATDDGATVSVPVAGGFADVEGDALRFAATGLPQGLSIDPATGVISGTVADASSRGGPNGDGVYRVAVTATDPSGRTVTTDFAWTIAPTAPRAADDRATTAEDTPVTIAALANDRDPDGDPLTLVAATATGGTVAIVDNALVFTPAPDFNGEAHIAYTLTDPTGNRASATVTVTVTPVNDAPDAAPIPAAHARDGQAVTLPVGAFFADRDGDTLRFSASGLPAGLSIDPATGTISGTLDRAASMVTGGVWRVVVTATDPSGASTRSGFDWIVVNPVPVAGDDAAATAEDTATVIAVLGNDSDPDGDPIVPVAATARHGSVVINPDGTLGYTPDRDFNGTDLIVYTISDGNGGRASASVLVTVTPVNDAPVAAPDRVTTAEDSAAVIPVLANDSDVDGNTLTIVGASAGRGAVTIQADGTLRYVPDADFNGEDTITYRIVDGQGGTATGTVAVTVTPVNDAPVAPDTTATTAEDAPLRIVVPASDVDGDPLAITTATASNGTVAINADGTFSYAPARDFNGIDTIRYTVSDGNGGQVTASVRVTVTPINDAPVAAPDRVTTAEDTAVIVSVLANDGDVDGDPLTIVGASAGRGAVTIQADGTLRYVPDADFNGEDTITYRIDDGQGGTATGTVAVTVTPVNDAPVAPDTTASTVEDTPLRIVVPASDVDGDPLTITAATASNGTIANNADGTLTYTPARDFNGTDTIRYTVSDGKGGQVAASVRVTVTPVNDAPVAAPDRATTAEDTAAVIPVLANDSDVDGDPLTIVAASAGHGAVSIQPDGTLRYVPEADFNGEDTITYRIDDGQGGTATGTVAVTVTPVNDAPVAPDITASTAEDTPLRIVVPASDVDGDPLTITAATASNGTVAINADGTLSYIPVRDFNGADTIRYSVADGRGGSASGAITIAVTPVEDAPAAALPAGYAPAARDGDPVAIDAGAWFADADGDALSFTATGLPAGLAIDPATGAIRGTLARDASQAAGGIYAVTVTARDPSGASTAVSFPLTITNPAPAARDATARTLEDTGITIPVLANAADPDGDPLSVVAASAARGTVTINADGSVTYVPAANFAGTDTIRYTVSDGQGGTATAIVTVTIDPVNDVSVIPDRAPIDAVGGRPIRIDALASASDAEGDRLTLVRATAANGSVVLNPGGTLVFTPALGFVGTTTIAVTVSDGQGGETTRTFLVRVADGRGADIEQLLRIGRVTFLDPTPALAIVPLADGTVRNPLSLLSAVEAIRPLGSTVIGDHPVGDAVEAIRTLRGTAIDPAAPIAGEVARLDALRDQRDTGDRLWDRRWDDFMVKGLSGFSHAADRQACVMIESVVRGNAIYLEVRDIAAEGALPDIRRVDLRMAGGGTVPDWIRVDPRGLAIIERPADADELHLVVRVTRADGRTTATPIVIQGATGEVELDRQHLRGHHAAPLDHSLNQPGASDAARLDRFFQ